MVLMLAAGATPWLLSCFSVLSVDGFQQRWLPLVAAALIGLCNLAWAWAQTDRKT